MSASSPVSVQRIPRPDEPVPALAVPAALFFVAGLALFGGSTAPTLTGTWPMAVSVLPNAVASYLLFTVAHDASHRSLSSVEWVNVWLGRVSLLFFAPHAAFWAVLLAVVAASIATGHVVELLVLSVVPTRLAIMWLGFAFDFLPHHGLHLTPSEDRFKTTRNRVGRERLLSPLLLYQNYHLVHHLHPTIPFHRYLAVWRRHEDRYLEGDPALTDVRGRPITPDEYRRLRELADH